MSKSISQFLKERIKPVYHSTPAKINFYSSVTTADVKEKLAEAKYEPAIKSAITDRNEEKQNVLHVVLQNKLFVTDKTELLMVAERDAKNYLG